MADIKAFAVIGGAILAYFVFMLNGRRWPIFRLVLLIVLPVVGVFFLLKGVYSLFRFARAKFAFR